MEKIYTDFFRVLLGHKDNLSAYIDSLYEGKKHSEADLNEIFGVLKAEQLVSGYYADNRFQNCMLTFKGEHYLDDEDKPHLLELIERIEEIEKEFHSFGTDYIITDSQIFQDWMQELQLELQLLYDETKDNYINDTLKFVKRGIGGFDERPDFSLLKSKLTAISKKKGHYFPEKTNKKASETDNKEPLIFISHSSKNKKQVQLFADMLLTIGLQPKIHVFCSSLPGYDIPVGEKIREYLHTLFLDYSLHVIFIQSADYYKSPYCLNEMGAAWVLQKQHTSVLLSGFDPADMKGIIKNDTVSIMLDHDKYEVRDKLNQLRNTLIEEFHVEKTPDSVWERARDIFIDNVNSVMSTPEKAVDDTAPSAINKEVIEFLSKISKSPNASLFICPNLSHGHTIETGSEIIATEYPDRREYAKWEEVIDNCVKFGYLKKTNDKMYVLTNSGYQIIGQ